MPKKLIKVDYAGEKCSGIYYMSDLDLKVITRKEAPAGHEHKFVIRQTVTVPGKGKITSKETHNIHGISFYKALQQVIREREPMRDRVMDKAMGINLAEEQEHQALIEALTVDALWDQYYEAHHEEWSPSYCNTLRSNYTRLVQPHIGKMRALSVKLKHMEDAIKAVKKTHSLRSQYAIKELVRGMYKWWLDREELDKRNPATMKLKKLNNAKQVNLTWEQIEKLYTAMYSYKDERYRQLFIWLSTGRRVGETLKLERGHLDGEYYTIVAANNKAKTDMIYRIPDGVTLPTHGRWIFRSPRNNEKPLQQVSVGAIWHNVCEEAGVTVTRHDLRHVITTKLKEAGAPLELRGMVIGHTIGGVTERYSTDTKQGADLKAMAVRFFLGKVFGSVDRELLWDNYIRV